MFFVIILLLAWCSKGIKMCILEAKTDMHTRISKLLFEEQEILGIRSSLFDHLSIIPMYIGWPPALSKPHETKTWALSCTCQQFYSV